MSGAMVGLVLDTDPEDLSATERLVLVAIAEEQRGVSDLVVRSVDWLTRRTGLGERTVRRVLPILRDKGRLSYWGGGGKRVVHRYRLDVVRDPADDRRFLWAAVDNPRNPATEAGYGESETLPQRQGMALNPATECVNPATVAAVPSPVTTPSSNGHAQTSLLLPFEGGRTDGSTAEETPTIDVDAVVAGVRDLGFPAPMKSDVRQQVVPTALVNGHTADTLLDALRDAVRRGKQSPHKIRLRNGTVAVLRDVARDPAPTSTTADKCPHKRPNGDRFTKDGDSLGGCRECEADAKALAEHVNDIARDLRMPS